MLPWFQHGKFPLYLAPMAGVTDCIFRTICKSEGADVLVTEFVSAEGIRHRNERTRDYLEFTEEQRPLGVQLFGSDPDSLAEAGRQVVEWVRPDFLDINFGCPAKKVTEKNGGSGLLRDCPLLESIARAVVRAVAPLPVTAKIRIGWDASTINATTTARILEQAGVQAIAVHGRTRAQGYSGQADWDVIAQVVQAVGVPVIGNGDIASGADVKRRREETGVAGVMIGRAAMGAPWVFRECKHYLATGEAPPPVPLDLRWQTIAAHAEAAVAARIRGGEATSVSALRSRLMAYSKGMPGGRHLRGRLQHVASLQEIEDIRRDHLAWAAGSEEIFPADDPHTDSEDEHPLFNGKFALAE